MQVTFQIEEIRIMNSKEAVDVFAPLSGPLLPLEQVPDDVFRSRMIGDGVAIDPTNETLYAPLAGEIVQIHPARHAMTIKTEHGFHILIHVGIDTVTLKGEGFRLQVEEGQKVQQGQVLLHFDADYVATHAKSLITVLLVIDSMVPTRVIGSHTKLAEARQSCVFKVSVEPDIFAEPDAKPSHESEAVFSLPLMITSSGGLHARPAGLLAAAAKNYPFDLFVDKNGQRANAKSLVAIMALEVSKNDQVRIGSSQVEAYQVVNELRDYIEQNLAKLAPTASPQTHPKTNAPQRQNSKTGLYWGVPASPGLAVGKIYQLREVSYEIPKIGQDKETELDLFKEAQANAETELNELQSQISAEGNSTQAAIFAAHLELLGDPELVESAVNGIRQGQSAAFAWNQSFQKQAQRLGQLNNELLAARANDLRDVGQRVLRLLLGHPRETQVLGEDTILVADNLTPSDTASLDRKKVRGFCTLSGGATSHVAILARSLGIPAIAAIDPEVLNVTSGTEVVIDGSQGSLQISPSLDDKNQALAFQRQTLERRHREMSLAHQPAKTLDGHWIEVAANIGGVSDAEEAVRHGCDGVGLLRSEFLFLERETAPDENEQLGIYQKIADILGERPLTVRTLDVGGDKPLKYLPIASEENPFLGLRGIRVGLKHEEILRTQLRALLRVEHKGEMRIMFPMISTLSEWRQANEILQQERKNLPHRAVKVGIMIEVPAAALLADALAQEVDFFSIGTNDLTQYTLAIDRGNQNLATQFDTLHPSVFKLIKMTSEAAHAHGKWVGVCGGIAGDAHAVPILLGLGVDELSISVPSLPSIKDQIRHLNSEGCRATADLALASTSGKEIKVMMSAFPHTQEQPVMEVL
jgi:phosphocarrier protein FPr